MNRDSIVPFQNNHFFSFFNWSLSHANHHSQDEDPQAPRNRHR